MCSMSPEGGLQASDAHVRVLLQGVGVMMRQAPQHDHLSCACMSLKCHAFGLQLMARPCRRPSLLLCVRRPAPPPITPVLREGTRGVVRGCAHSGTRACTQQQQQRRGGVVPWGSGGRWWCAPSWRRTRARAAPGPPPAAWWLGPGVRAAGWRRALQYHTAGHPAPAAAQRQTDAAMYFAYGWPKAYNAGVNGGSRYVFLHLDQEYFVGVTEVAIQIWSGGQHRVKLGALTRTHEEISEEGTFTKATWFKHTLAVLVREMSAGNDLLRMLLVYASCLPSL